MFTFGPGTGRSAGADVRFIRNFCAHAKGGTAIEYGLILALIVVAIIASLSSFADHAVSMFTNVSTKISQAG
jgi:pilus assembly protein Flp/PilA